MIDSRNSFSSSITQTDENINIDVLVSIIEQIIGHCYHLLSSQQRIELGILNHRETVSHLRSIFDESTSRQQKNIATLTHFPKILKNLDIQYYRFKDRVKALIKHCVQDLETNKNSYEEAYKTFETREAELFSAQNALKNLSVELASLEESKKLHSSCHNIDSLSQTVEQLQKENKELASKKKALMDDIEMDRNQLSGNFDHLKDLDKSFIGIFPGGKRDSIIGESSPVDQSVREELIRLDKILNETRSRYIEDKERYSEMLEKEEGEVLLLRERVEELYYKTENCPNVSTHRESSEDDRFTDAGTF